MAEFWEYRDVEMGNPSGFSDLGTVGLCVCVCVCVCVDMCVCVYMCVYVCVHVWCVYIHASWQLNWKAGEQGYKQNQTPQSFEYSIFVNREKKSVEFINSV